MASIGPIQIFGRSVSVIVDDSEAGGILARELALYAAADVPPQRTIRVGHRPPPAEGLVNPALHVELPDGFVARYPNAAVTYRLAGDTPSAEVHLAPATRGFAAWRSRWRSVQYATAEEQVGQLFHELALVPLLYVDRDRLPIHASAFDVPGAGMTLIGGTGGVGKTTLAIDLCLRHGAAFAADDIAVVDREGSVHPNLAFPKIYGYNLEGDPALADRVLGRAGRAERLQWRWRRRRRGPAQVRRRLSPLDLYGRVVSEPAPLRRYLILVREHRDAVRVDPLDPARAAAMSAMVLRAEYELFNRHLAWHAFNVTADGREPSVVIDDVVRAWRSLGERILAGVDCRLVRVPVGAPHAALRRELAGIVADV